MRKISIPIIASCLLCALPASAARAATIEFSDFIDLMTTNWTSDVSFPKFDPALGTLNSVSLELEAFVKGLAKFESLDPSATTVTVNFFADVRLRRPDFSDMIVAVPGTSHSEMVTPFDGTIDFDGTSGRTLYGLSNSATESTTITAPLSPGDAALFVGTAEIVTLNVRARGASSGMGPGNLILLFNTQAAANVRVIYDYTPIPEPASLALLAAGAMIVLRRRPVHCRS